MTAVRKPRACMKSLSTPASPVVSRMAISNGWSCNDIVNADNPDGANTQGYCNPTMDELMVKQATTLDPAARLEIF